PAAHGARHAGGQHPGDHGQGRERLLAQCAWVDGDRAHDPGRRRLPCLLAPLGAPTSVTASRDGPLHACPGATPSVCGPRIAFTRGATCAAVGDIDRVLPSLWVGGILRHLFATAPGGPSRAVAGGSIEGVAPRHPAPAG